MSANAITTAGRRQFEIRAAFEPDRASRHFTPHFIQSRPDMSNIVRWLGAGALACAAASAWAADAAGCKDPAMFPDRIPGYAIAKCNAGPASHVFRYGTHSESVLGRKSEYVFKAPADARAEPRYVAANYANALSKIGAQLLQDPAKSTLGDRVVAKVAIDGRDVWVSVLSMGNPHAVMRVDDVDTAPVATLGPWIESHPRFAQGVNAGFMQVVSPQEVRLRVYERGAGETLACGTGACAAVVAGIQQGWLSRRVDVHTRGGMLTIEWTTTSVLMTGPTQTVFEGEIEL